MTVIQHVLSFFIKLLVYLYSKSGPGTLVCQSRILTSENEVLKKKLISAEKKIELLEKALKDNSNEAERSHVICGALNDLDSVKGRVSFKEEQRLKLQKELTTLHFTAASKLWNM